MNSKVSRAGNAIRLSRGTRSKVRSEEHTSELQSLTNLVCRLLLEKKKTHAELQSLTNIVCSPLLERQTIKVSHASTLTNNIQRDYIQYAYVYYECTDTALDPHRQL